MGQSAGPSQEPPCPPGPRALPTSASAVLGPAILVQLLGIFVVVIVSQGLLALSVLEQPRREDRQVAGGAIQYRPQGHIPTCPRAAVQPKTHASDHLDPTQEADRSACRVCWCGVVSGWSRKANVEHASLWGWTNH